MEYFQEWEDTETETTTTKRTRKTRKVGGLNLKPSLEIKYLGQNLELTKLSPSFRIILHKFMLGVFDFPKSMSKHNEIENSCLVRRFLQAEVPVLQILAIVA